MIKSFSEAVKYLEQYIPTDEQKHPGRLGIERMFYLVSLLGNPQVNFRTIHVGGTSGKGSTATLIATILSSKYKVGLHTSPHLERINERMKLVVTRLPARQGRSSSRRLRDPAETGLVVSKDISDKDFIELINKIKPAVRKMEGSKLGVPSYFEILTGMAFLYFKEQKVDLAVIEVGMGGRFDATNVIKPEVAVITNVGLDHIEVLGETVEEIARDKTGIIKKGITVVSGVDQQSVIKILEEKTKREKAKLYLLNRDFDFKIQRISQQGSVFDYRGNKKMRNLALRLLGEHQIENAAIAIKTVEEWNGISEKDIRMALKNTQIAGRLEIVRKKPLVILDGAHNPDKMKALVKAIKTIWRDKKVTLVLAIKEGKDALEMLRLILPIAKKVILTKYQLLTDQGNIRSYDPVKIKKIIDENKYNIEIEIINKAQEAVEKTLRTAHEEDLILVSGSLYLIGIIRSLYG
ncbi:hypothetical protein A2W14_04760 [Candidatus Gottesmanbacteria bacterium RBG_16_37_8]|uniref:tetrahydrofolate synthase n=1 Tax=Candidatus Gottesmanbacteria bacterium RBG_16_37_8 TaxID=1798371 RepID=A0A1F5YUN1_9BACT|nr:MAG: hypothetical protein A2W14_04760 [Candidatus Gottesmanbacteria bacterium RBG_16_37_8]